MEGDPPQVERLQGASRGSESAHAVDFLINSVSAFIQKNL